MCPHAVIRMKAYDDAALDGAPDGFLSKAFRSRELPDHRLTVQVSPDDCTGCAICVEVCPAKDKTELKRKAINMRPVDEHADIERDPLGLLPRRSPSSTAPPSATTRSRPRSSSSRSSSSAGPARGCGETQYLKLLTQLFGDRLVVANATGCSSIYGGNLPTTPWTTTADGLGPAWSNSLFEDNAEFGLGLRLGVEHHQREAAPPRRRVGRRDRRRVRRRRCCRPTQTDEAAVIAQRDRVGRAA